MSNTKGVYFNGKLLTIPGAYSSVESSMTSTKAGNNAKMIAILGECTGGEPETVQFFTEPSVANKVLKSGELLKAMQKAWNPVSKTKEGVSLGGANIIAAIRTNKATKGESIVNQSQQVDATIGSVVKSVSGATTGKVTAGGEFTGESNKTIKIVITSSGTNALADCTYNWCLANEDVYKLSSDAKLTTEAITLIDGVTATFSAGNYTLGDVFFIPCTAAVTTGEFVFKIQSKDWGADASNIQHKISDGTLAGTKKLTLYNSKTDAYEIYDNLGKIFSIKYTGSQKYAAISIISDGAGNAIKLQTYIGADKDTAIVDLDLDLSTKSFKNVVSLVHVLSGYENYVVSSYNSFNPELSVNDLDFMDRVDIKTETEITAVLPDMKKSVALQSQLCEITIINREIDNFDNYDFTTLIGGSEGRSPLSWASFFDMLSRYNITYITPLTDDLSIIAECQEHVNHMSENMGKERRIICGSGNRLTVDTAIINAKRLSSDRCQYVYPGMYDLNDSGELELYPAYILAAQHAGRAAFLTDGEAATHDHYRMSAIETELEPDEITKLLNAGVVTFELVISGEAYETSSVRMVQDLTTYTSDTNPLYCERAIGIVADTLNKDLRNDLDDLLVGKRTTTAALTTARNRVISILQKRKKDEIIVAYKDVNVYKENDAVWVEYAVAPAEPTNFVLIKSHFYSEGLAVTDSSN
jgi:hypothetical protein